MALPQAMGMSFPTEALAKIFSGTHTTDHTVFAIRAIDFGNNLATTSCLANHWLVSYNGVYIIIAKLAIS